MFADELSVAEGASEALATDVVAGAEDVLAADEVEFAPPLGETVNDVRTSVEAACVCEGETFDTEALIETPTVGNAAELLSWRALNCFVSSLMYSEAVFKTRLSPTRKYVQRISDI